ncbi:replicative DNA helicase [Candidatus Gracilibacteria bacterium]|nr:replicative DNA helicase [Candidatus Gracilibacteria bacterium]
MVKQDTTGMTPPAELDAEKAVLGSILLNMNLIDDVADKLKSRYFYDSIHEFVFEVMIELWSNGKQIDVVSILDKIYSSKSSLAKEVSKDYLLELISKVSLISGVISAGEIIKQKYLLRTLINAGDKLKTMATIGTESPENLLDDAQKVLYEVSVDQVDKNFVALTDVLADTFERISELHNSNQDYSGLPTGLIDLDNILGGLHKSDLIILAARPSMGKTSLALEMVKRIALFQQQGVAVFSLEMSKDQLSEKLIASTSGVALAKIRSGHLNDDPGNNDFERLTMALGQLDQAPIWIDDSGSLNILELRTKARRLKSKLNIGLIVIDYLQLMSGKGEYKGNRVQEVTDISRGLKILAKELDIPILALSQLSRSVDSRDDKRPMLSDLRESGSIEQDADVVMFVHREEMYHRETKKKNVGDILVAKHRNGQTGAVELAWVPRLATFDNLQGAKISRRVNE